MPVPGKEYLIKEMARKQGVAEELKARGMLRWAGKMNNIRACADEIVLNDMSVDGSFSFSASIQEVIKL